jgi:hypothetical protein
MAHARLVALAGAVALAAALAVPAGETGAVADVDPVHSGIAIGLHLAYFSYEESLDLDEILRDFGVDSMIGKPKSTERGLCPGLRLELTAAGRTIPIFFRPRLEVILGLANSYDGSSQAKPVEDSYGDTVAIQFDPVTDTKQNYFFRVGADLGYHHGWQNSGLALYTGADARLWNRSIDQMNEYYYWFSEAFGASLRWLLPQQWTIGVDARADVMFAGWMRITASTTSNGPGRQRASLPAVKLANRPGWRLQMPVEKRFSHTLGLRLVPWMESYRFGRSNTRTVEAYDYYSYTEMTYYEPASSSLWGGLTVDLMLYFGRKGE